MKLTLLKIFNGLFILLASLIILFAVKLIIFDVITNKQIEHLKDQNIKNPKPPTFQPAQTNFSDQEILNAVYSNYQVPNSFFEDALVKTEKENNIFYERRTYDSSLTFFCANDFNESKKLVEKHIKIIENRAKYKRITLFLTIAETSEKEKFFEFKVTDNQNIPDNKLFRVIKCSYIRETKRLLLNDYQYQRGFTSGYVGEFIQRPITPEKVKELVEILWFIGFEKYSDNDNIDQQKVLSSFTKNQNTSIVHTIYGTNVLIGGIGGIDKITLTKSVYTVDKNSGKIYLTKETVKSIDGNYNAFDER